jgi:hypothetical protein
MIRWEVTTSDSFPEIGCFGDNEQEAEDILRHPYVACIRLLAWVDLGDLGDRVDHL